MITFEEFDEAITNVAIDAVFPKRDLYKKTIYSHDELMKLAKENEPTFKEE